MDGLVAALVVVAVVAWHNGLQLSPERRRDLVVSVGVGAAAVVGAVWLWSSVAPTRGLVGAWPWTVGAVVVSGLVVAVAHRSERVAEVVSDRRIAGMTSRQFALHAMLRIPVLTALAEEVLFRGVAWALLGDVGGSLLAWLGSSFAFALGHVVVARDQARREGHHVGRWIAVTLAMTGLAGLGLGALRLWTGGIWAPLGVHATVNVVLSLGARSVTPDPIESPDRL